METPQQITNALTFVSQILREDILPAVESLGSASSVDMSPILASLLTVQTSLTDLDTLVTDSFNNIPKTLLLEYVVSANCTSVDLGSFFDIKAHKSYRIEIDLMNATGSNSELLFFVNGDLANSNYVSYFAQFTSVLTYQNNVARPVCGLCYASGISRIDLSVSILGGIPIFLSQSCDKTASNTLYSRLYSGLKISAVPNITQLTFVSSVAYAIKAGSVIRVYRGDV